MLSIDRVRELMERPDLSDEEATRLRDDCAAMAESIIESLEYQQSLKPVPSFLPLEVPNVPMSTRSQ
jgi:hypothetical protein